MNNVNSITIVSEIKIDIWMPVAICYWCYSLENGERGKLLCSHIMEGCPIENAIKSSANQISTSAPVVCSNWLFFERAGFYMYLLSI